MCESEWLGSLLHVTVHLRCNTNIILYGGKIGRVWWQFNQRLIIFINNARCLYFFQVCLNWLLILVWSTYIIKISDNFIYCHFLFVHVSDVIDCFRHLSICYVNFKHVTITNNYNWWFSPLVFSKINNINLEKNKYLLNNKPSIPKRV